MEGSVGGLSVGLPSVLSHYTSTECYILVVFNFFKDILNVIMYCRMSMYLMYYNV